MAFQPEGSQASVGLVKGVIKQCAAVFTADAEERGRGNGMRGDGGNDFPLHGLGGADVSAAINLKGKQVIACAKASRLFEL